MGPLDEGPLRYGAYAVLAPISRGCPPLQDMFRCITHPDATLLRIAPFRVRLACVRHAASVDSEPGSNSQLFSFAHYTHLLNVVTSVSCNGSSTLFHRWFVLSITRSYLLAYSQRFTSSCFTIFLLFPV